MQHRTLSKAQLEQRYGEIQQRIKAAGGRDVTVVAVTKSFSSEAIDLAASSGICDVAESYAAECVAKLAQVVASPKPRMHFVGRVQRNKVKLLAGSVDIWQSVDRAELGAEIAKRAPGAEVMIQVNISAEPAKGGCAREYVESLASAISDQGLQLVGLMGMGRLGVADQNRRDFRWLRRTTDDLGLVHCSMGMTDDLEIAASEGATMVRVGRGLFGERSPM